MYDDIAPASSAVLPLPAVDNSQPLGVNRVEARSRMKRPSGLLDRAQHLPRRPLRLGDADDTSDAHPGIWARHPPYLQTLARVRIPQSNRLIVSPDTVDNSGSLWNSLQ